MQPVRAAQSYADLSALVGRRFAVDVHQDLVLEGVSTPWRCEGRHGDLALVLRLEPVARDTRFTHYEAWLTEPAGLLAVG